MWPSRRDQSACHQPPPRRLDHVPDESRPKRERETNQDQHGRFAQGQTTLYRKILSSTNERRGIHLRDGREYHAHARLGHKLNRKRRGLSFPGMVSIQPQSGKLLVIAWNKNSESSSTTKIWK